MNNARMDFYQAILARKLEELYSTINGKRVEAIRDFDEPEPDIYDLCVQSYSKEQLFFFVNGTERSWSMCRKP